MSSVVTDEMLNIACIVWGVVSGVSVLSCLLILAASAYMYTIPEARHCLDRVSYRLMLWSAGMEVVNAIFWMITSVNPPFVAYLYEDNYGACVGSTYAIIATTGAINWLNACIGLNLALAIRYSMKMNFRRLEWWYIGGSLFLGFFIPLVPAILGHFGPDPIYELCWFTEADPRTRIGWMMLDFYIWQTLACIIGMGAVAMVLYTTVLHGRTTTRALLIDNIPNSKTSSELKLNHLQDKLVDIAMRVAAYPVILSVTILVSMASDLYFTFYPIDTIARYALDIIGTLVLCGRGLVFGVLVVFVDPSLRRAFRAVRQVNRTSLTDELPEDPAGESFIEFLSVGAIDDRRPSTASVNMTNALRYLPFDPRSPPEARSLTVPTRGKSSRSFPGVPTASLPGDFTDDVDMEMPKIFIIPEPPRRSVTEDAARRLQEIEAML